MKYNKKRNSTVRRKKTKKFSFGRLSRARILLFVLVFGLVGALYVFRSFGAAPNATVSMGVFRGSNNPSAVAGYESWLGRPVTYALDFTGKNDVGTSNPWSKIDNPGSVCSAWDSSKYKLILSTALLPNTDFNLASGAGGSYDSHWKSFGEKMVSAGCGDATLRLGWEFNGKFYAWAAGGKEANFAAYWRRVVNILRATPGQSFRFDFTPLAGNGNADVEAAYPGDAYVDIIGLDAYDTSDVHSSDSDRWNDQVNRVYGLKWQKDFATKHGKPVGYGEWGLTVRPNDNLGGGDNPYYIQKMFEWMNSLPTDGPASLAYHSYFEYDAKDASHRLMLGQFPDSAAKFKQLFGVLPSTSAPTDTTKPSAPTSLEATVAGQTQIDLAWSASSDNVGVVSYDVYRGTSKVANVGNTTYSDTGLTAGTAYSYYVVARDAAGNVSPASNTTTATTSGSTTTPPPPPPDGSSGVLIPYRQRSGSANSYKDPAGLVWAADKYYATSSSNGVGSTASGIANTDKDPLYQTERWGVSSYNIPVVNGTYTLRLHFAEINPASGERIFDVSAENQALLTNYNISSEAGDFTAVAKEFIVTVEDGELTLGFSKTSNATKISGFEILDPVVPPPPTLLSKEFTGKFSKFSSKTFSVSLPKAGSVSYTAYKTSSKTGRYNVEVLDPRGISVHKREDGVPTFKEIFTATEAGTYQIKFTSEFWSPTAIKLVVEYPN